MKISEHVSNLILGSIIILLSVFSLYSSIRFIIKGITFDKVIKNKDMEISILSAENNLLRKKLGI